LKDAEFLPCGQSPAAQRVILARRIYATVSTRARYNLPVGPIRLDYNYSPSPASSEAMGAFHFSISRGLNSKMSASIERLTRTFLQYRAESRAGAGPEQMTSGK
jgi:hypothetical protein